MMPCPGSKPDQAACCGNTFDPFDSNVDLRPTRRSSYRNNVSPEGGSLDEGDATPVGGSPTPSQDTGGSATVSMWQTPTPSVLREDPASKRVTKRPRGSKEKAVELVDGKQELLYSTKNAFIMCVCGERIEFSVEIEREGRDGVDCKSCYRRVREDFVALLAELVEEGYELCDCNVDELADCYLREQPRKCKCKEKGFDTQHTCGRRGDSPRRKEAFKSAVPGNLKQCVCKVKKNAPHNFESIDQTPSRIYNPESPSDKTMTFNVKTAHRNMFTGRKKSRNRRRDKLFVYNASVTYDQPATRGRNSGPREPVDASSRRDEGKRERQNVCKKSNGIDGGEVVGYGSNQQVIGPPSTQPCMNTYCREFPYPSEYKSVDPNTNREESNLEYVPGPNPHCVPCDSKYMERDADSDDDSQDGSYTSEVYRASTQRGFIDPRGERERNPRDRQDNNYRSGSPTNRQEIPDLRQRWDRTDESRQGNYEQRRPPPTQCYMDTSVKEYPDSRREFVGNSKPNGRQGYVERNRPFRDFPARDSLTLVQQVTNDGKGASQNRSYRAANVDDSPRSRQEWDRSSVSGAFKDAGAREYRGTRGERENGQEVRSPPSQTYNISLREHDDVRNQRGGSSQQVSVRNEPPETKLSSNEDVRQIPTQVARVNTSRQNLPKNERRRVPKSRQIDYFPPPGQPAMSTYLRKFPYDDVSSVQPQGPLQEGRPYDEAWRERNGIRCDDPCRYPCQLTYDREYKFPKPADGEEGGGPPNQTYYSTGCGGNQGYSNDCNTQPVGEVKRGVDEYCCDEDTRRGYVDSDVQDCQPPPPSERLCDDRPCQMWRYKDLPPHYEKMTVFRADPKTDEKKELEEDRRTGERMSRRVENVVYNRDVKEKSRLPYNIDPHGEAINSESVPVSPDSRRPREQEDARGNRDQLRRCESMTRIRQMNTEQRYGDAQPLSCPNPSNQARQRPADEDAVPICAPPPRPCPINTSQQRLNTNNKIPGAGPPLCPYPETLQKPTTEKPAPVCPNPATWQIPVEECPPPVCGPPLCANPNITQKPINKEKPPPVCGPPLCPNPYITQKPINKEKPLPVCGPPLCPNPYITQKPINKETPPPVCGPPLCSNPYMAQKPIKEKPPPVCGPPLCPNPYITQKPNKEKPQACYQPPRCDYPVYESKPKPTPARHRLPPRDYPIFSNERERQRSPTQGNDRRREAQPLRTPTPTYAHPTSRYDNSTKRRSPPITSHYDELPPPRTKQDRRKKYERYSESDYDESDPRLHRNLSKTDLRQPNQHIIYSVDRSRRRSRRSAEEETDPDERPKKGRRKRNVEDGRDDGQGKIQEGQDCQQWVYKTLPPHYEKIALYRCAVKPNQAVLYDEHESGHSVEFNTDAPGLKPDARRTNFNSRRDALKDSVDEDVKVPRGMPSTTNMSRQQREEGRRKPSRPESRDYRTSKDNRTGHGDTFQDNEHGQSDNDDHTGHRVTIYSHENQHGNREYRTNKDNRSGGSRTSQESRPRKRVSWTSQDNLSRTSQESGGGREDEQESQGEWRDRPRGILMTRSEEKYGAKKSSGVRRPNWHQFGGIY